MKHPLSAVLALAAAAYAHAQAQQPQTHRDPFARPALPAAAAAGAAAEAQAAPVVPPQLRAILYAQTQPLANISGQILAVGDRFGDYQVARIRERSVTLVRNGVKSELGLDEAGSK